MLTSSLPYDILLNHVLSDIMIPEFGGFSIIPWPDVSFCGNLSEHCGFWGEKRIAYVLGGMLLKTFGLLPSKVKVSSHWFKYEDQVFFWVCETT